ncbi:MAG: sigma 54-interacting transcriptional regulator [Clostridiales bacterium]
MRPRIAIISGFSNWSSYLHNMLSSLFSEKIEIIEYNSDKNIISKPVIADLILISEPIIYYSSYRFFDLSTPTVTISSTITLQQYEMLRTIPVGTRVLVVNDTNNAVIETISKFMDLGLNHLEYYPYSPDSITITNEEQPSVAVTPGEPELVPSYIETVINIGNRVIDPHSLSEIAIRTGLEYLLESEPIIQYMDNVCTSKNSLSYLLERTTATSKAFFSLSDNLDKGIVVVDQTGLLQNCNEKAANIIGNRENTIGKHISQVLPCQLTRDIRKISHDTGIKLIKIGGITVSLRIIPISANGAFCGAIIEISHFAEEEKRQFVLQQYVLKKGHIAKRTFEDVIALNPDMLNLKFMAEKYAKSAATILITGESGTGKEILAQAIHNASDRKNGPFVAVNCSALPVNLLESELFGYEEGAFTGAKKSGKAGLFELASTGTFFLDEIGDMDLYLQSRILRVLEEREIRRIGGGSVYPVDIRMVAATNQNLLDMIDKGAFRKDLYYRLNVIPLELIPLRHRPEDILPLFHHFAKLQGFTFTLSPQAESKLLAYPWYGNVRELKNKVEHLAALDMFHLEVEDLENLLNTGSNTFAAKASFTARLMQDCASFNPAESSGLSSDQSQKGAMRQFRNEIAGREFYYYLVMKALVKSCGQGVGRLTIFQDIRKEKYQMSEVEIRKIIGVLCRYQLAIQGKGRMGARITPLGVEYFEQMQESSSLKKMLGHLER